MRNCRFIKRNWENVVKSIKIEKLSFDKNNLKICLVGKLSIENMSGWENVWLRICRLILRICRLRKNRIGNLSLARIDSLYSQGHQKRTT